MEETAFGYFFLALLGAITFIVLYMKIEKEEDYVGKCWFFIIAVIAALLYLYFLRLGVDILNHPHNVYSSNSIYYDY